MNTIDRSFITDYQSLNLYHFSTFKNKSIKIEIKVDHYNNQSYARSYLLTSECGWKEIYFIKFPDMTAIKDKISYITELECRMAMIKDEEKIIIITEQILKDMK
jgi:hypothetical protein